MKIAMMVRGYIPAPRPVDMIYAPIDLAIALSDGLVRRGHHVDFFGPLGTTLELANVRTRNLRPLIHNQKEFLELLGDMDKMAHAVPHLWDGYLARDMMQRAKRGEYDLLHFHHPETMLEGGAMYASVPIVYTLHDPLDPVLRELFELYQSPNQRYISISKNQRRDAPDLPYVANVYNGVDLQRWPFGDEPEDYLLAAGRIVPEKGFKEAIQVAKQTSHRLLIIGPVYPGRSQEYFDQYIKPQLSDQILYLGFVEQDQLWRYYQKAKAFLTPIQWEEPFGLTTIEAMACGAPVISLKRGAAPELIKDGKTGYVVQSVAEMAAAVGKIDKISRSACRDHVEAHFSIDAMVAHYEAAYEATLRKRSPTRKGKTFVTQKLLAPRTLPKLPPIVKAVPKTPPKNRQLGLKF